MTGSQSSLLGAGHHPASSSRPPAHSQQRQQPPSEHDALFPEAPTFAETIQRVVAYHPPATPVQLERGLVLYEEPPPPPPQQQGYQQRERVYRPFGLSSVQTGGRDEVLQHFCKNEAPVQAAESQRPARPPRLSHPRDSSANGGRAPAQASLMGQGSATSSEALELEWSSLSDAAKHALKQWLAGQVGGRHCMLVLENNAGADSALAMLGQDEPMTCDLRGGAALNVLSGLFAEVGLIGGTEGTWLHEAVFSKTPQAVLEEALFAAVAEIADPRIERPADLSPEQVNLALRRRVMKAQYEAAVSAVQPKGGHAPGAAEPASNTRSAEESMRVQVWLELVRLHIEGSQGGAQAGGGGGGSSSSVPAGKDRDKAGKDGGRGGAVASSAWHDGVVIKDMIKEEADLEAESNQMALEALRVQNKAIEEYVMRLVRQRDELKQITKMAEERDSYFILGLSGPEATDSEVKKAYRNLARKEHPDKAGQANKKRFQAIQHAYNQVLRQRKEAGAEDGAGAGAGRPGSASAPGGDANQQAQALSAVVTKATELSKKAMDAADKVAMCAHRCLRGGEEAMELQNQPKRKALRVLRELTKQGAIELRGASEQLIVLGDAIRLVATCTEAAMEEHKDWAGMTVAGVNLRDRAVIVEDAGNSGESTAQLLEKIAEATEATLKKVEKASPEVTGSGDPGSGSAAARAPRGDEAANLLRLGTRLLGESLSRTAAVARRSADEAITGAMKAFELSRGLAAMDMEARKEREKMAAKQAGFDEDSPMPAGDAERPSAAGGEDEVQEDTAEKEEDSDKKEEEPKTEPTPRDQLKSAAKRVKERHVALRVKNLKFLNTLNEEALRMQGRLRALLLRSEGTLLPKVSVAQKQMLFDLIAQLFDFAVSESSKLSANPSATPIRVLERSLSFALALEHVKEIAMPSDSRTQALKLAALVDADLLCEIVEGPFRRRLMAVGAKRKAEPAPPGTRGLTGITYGNARSVMAAASQPGAALKAWEDAVNSFCVRVCEALRHIVVEVTEPKDDAPEPE